MLTVEALLSFLASLGYPKSKVEEIVAFGGIDKYHLYWMKKHMQDKCSSCADLWDKVDNEGLDYYYGTYTYVENVPLGIFATYRDTCFCDHSACPGGCKQCVEEKELSECKVEREATHRKT